MSKGKRYPVYALSSDYSQSDSASHRLGGYGKDDPPRITVKGSDPYIYNDQPDVDKYEVYVGTILRKMPVPAEIKSVQANIDSIADMIESDGELEVAVAPAPLAESTIRRAESKASDPVVVEPPQEVEAEEVDLKTQIPPKGKLSSMKRDELSALANEIGEWDNIEASGTDGYVTKGDIIEHLLQIAEA